jgi:DNA/RNA-binding domain of Phe-tRNA-synthetase-like protein
MVDILNLGSIQTGFSIGGYDADTIIGNVSFGIGKPGEPYEGIGRGSLNIENLPVFRDSQGAFGTSTSDSVRTMVTENTKRFLMVIPVFTHIEDEPDKALELAIQLLKRYGNVSEYELFTNI